jgi:hypothetical protein
MTGQTPDQDGEARAVTGIGVGRDTAPSPGAPRWVKVSGIIGIVVVLMIAVMLLTGHGPQRHLHAGPGRHGPAVGVTAAAGVVAPSRYQFR